MAQITLFIEDSDIKMLMAKGNRVEKWAKLPLEPGLVSDGLILDEDQVSTKVRELLKLKKVGERTVVASLSGFNSVYRLLSLPELPPALLPEAVLQEASRVVPVPMNQVYISYQALPSPAGETRVFLAAYPRNATDALLNTLKKAGLRVILMDLAPLALCRTVDAPQSVVINVSAATFDIAVMVDKTPQVIRSLSIPGEAQSLSERIPSIVEELNRTIAFYNSSHRDAPLEKTVPIFVSGDLATATDEWQSISGAEGYSVSAIESPLQVSEGFDASQFMINIGLALKQLTLEKEGNNLSIVNFNALPQAEKPKKSMSPLNIVLPIIIVLGIGGMYYLYNQVRNTTAQNDLLRNQLTVIQTQMPQQQDEITAVRDEIAQMEPMIEPLEVEASAFGTTFTTLGATRDVIDADSITVVQSLPAADVDLLSVSHTGDQISVNGIALEESGIFEYARALRSSGRFSLVVISSIETTVDVVPAEEEGEEDQEITQFDFQFTLLK